MAGRHLAPCHHNGLRNLRDPVMRRGPGSMPIHPSALEEELEIQNREIQRILAENRNVIDGNTFLQQELTAAKDEIHRLGQVIPQLREDKEVGIRMLFERGMQLEVDLRASEPLRMEVIQLRSEMQKLNSLRQELSSQVQGLTKDINQLQAENQQLIGMRADIERMHKELVEARRAYEYEKKANEEQVEQKQAMEKNLISMAREIEMLRAERMHAVRRTQGLGGGGYSMLDSSPEMRYPGSSYGDGYGSPWGHSNRHGPSRR